MEHSTLKDTQGANDAGQKAEVSIKNLYAINAYGRRSPTRWSEYADPDVEEKELQRLTAGYDVVHRKMRGEDRHGNTSWQTHSILIRGDLKRDILATALEGYPNLDLKASELEFKPPFEPLVHRWEKLQERAVEMRDSAVTAEDRARVVNNAVLLKTLRGVVSSSLAALDKIKTTGKIDFDMLWTIFPPGELVLGCEAGADRVFRILAPLKLVRPQDGRPYWVFRYEYLDWNGHVTGFATDGTTITEYEGAQPVQSLHVVPLKTHPDSQRVTTRLTQRGRRFEALRGYHFKVCEGTRMTGGAVKPVNGRVIVDTLAYYQCQEAVKPALRAADEPLILHDDDSESPDDDQSSSSHGWGPRNEARNPAGKGGKHGNQDEVDAARWPNEEQEASRTNDLPRLVDEECLLASPYVRGMDLKTKEWSTFWVDELRDIAWNMDLFPRLVLPDGDKELVLAACKHKRRTDIDVDFVADKGRGLILLLFGPPGVGKSFTAEAVAEELHVPLYFLTAGDLGTQPKSVEKALDRAFQCCTLWNAVLLLDEADVFLGTRTVDGLDRNELVSIFLRTLEHYRGTLFLTTNRMKAVDPAFQSRLDFMIPYDDLDAAARRQVWTNFIGRVGPERFALRDADFDRLAAFDINGREIKNLIKSALLLAFEDQSKVTMGHLQRLAAMRVKAQRLLMS